MVVEIFCRKFALIGNSRYLIRQPLLINSYFMAKYYIEKDSKGQYYWILVSDKNGKTICMSSESYVSKQGSKDSIMWNKVNGKTETVIDLT